MDFQTLGLMISTLTPMNETNEDYSIENNTGYGKDICERLNNIRNQMAIEHGLDYKSEKCNYMEACTGPCSKCEEDAKYLYTIIYNNGGGMN